MFNLVMVGIAIILTLVGLITSIMPIPGGVLVSVAGIAMLIYYSPKAKLSIQWLRLKIRLIDRLFELMELAASRYVPVIARRLSETRPMIDEPHVKLSHRAYITKVRQVRKNKMKR